jgi:hypothetical protein
LQLYRNRRHHVWDRSRLLESFRRVVPNHADPNESDRDSIRSLGLSSTRAQGEELVVGGVNALPDSTLPWLQIVQFTGSVTSRHSTGALGTRTAVRCGSLVELSEEELLLVQ